jgi:hypothetical protein
MPMKVILDVKDGRTGNVLGILSAWAWAGGMVWLAVYRDDGMLLYFFAPLCCVASLVVSHGWFQNIRHPKSGVLAIDGDRLVWMMRQKEEGEVQKLSLPLRSITGLEVVLPRMDGEPNTRNYVLAELFLRDIHGNRHRLPAALHPAVYRKKIIAALQEAIPALKVSERIDKP